MKFLSCAALSLFTTTMGSFAEGEWQRLILRADNGGTTITVPAGKLLETTVPIFAATNPFFEFRYDLGGGNVIERFDFELLNKPGNVVLGTQSLGAGLFVGPSSLTLRMVRGTGFTLIQYRLLENPAIPVVAGAVINAPASPSEPLLVKLQVSSDLDEWVDVATYNAGISEQKQFFRIFAEGE